MNNKIKVSKVFSILYAITILLFFVRNCVLTGDYSKMVILHFITVSILFIAPSILLISFIISTVYNKIRT